MNRSDCHDVLTTLFDEWLDPSLDSTRRQEVQREVERVIADYPEGEREWQSLLELGATLHEMPTFSAPPNVRSNINAALHAQAAPRRRWYQSLNSLTWAGSATFAMLVLWLLVRPLTIPPPQIVREPVMQESAPEPTSALDSAATPSPRNAEATRKTAPKAKSNPAKPNSEAPKNQVTGKGPATSGKPEIAADTPSATMQAAPSNATSRRDSATAPLARKNSGSPEIRFSKQLPETAPSLTAPRGINSQPSLGASGPARPKNSPPALIAPRIAVPDTTRDMAPSPKIAGNRMRSGTLENGAGGGTMRQDLAERWSDTEISIVAVPLPVNRGFLPAPETSKTANRVLAAPSKPAVAPKTKLPSFIKERGLPIMPPPNASQNNNDAVTTQRDAENNATAMAGKSNGPTLAAPPQALTAPLVAPSAAANAESGTVTLQGAPAAITGALPPIVAPQVDNGPQESAKKVFTAPTPRRFRLTITSPRFLGPARVRLEGSPSAPKTPIWQGILEEQKSVSIDIETIITPGETLNVVLEQIRPNGESGEYKTFPLVRP